MLKGKKILVGISGGIAAYKVCSLIRLFVKNGADVRVIMTPSAVNFVSPLTLSVLSKNEVIINMFPENKDLSKAEKVGAGTWHINLGIWADVFLIAPATANTISKIYAGISDNFLLSVALASRCPVILAPTMDEDMYCNKITRRNIEGLKSFGFKVIDPVEGELASGLFGKGKMPEPQSILDFTAKILNPKKDLGGIKVLISAGPTQEPIDAVRYISNYSSGRMGFELARAAKERGADVTLITGPVHLHEAPGVKRINVKTSSEMLDAVRKNFRNKELVIMSAAVSDFTPVKLSDKKLKKEELGTNFSLKLKKTEDILRYLGDNKDGFKLIGFALETDKGIENARKKLREKNLDVIVLNNPLESGAGFISETNIAVLIDNKNIVKLPKMSKYELGNMILDYYLKNL
ncbi:MAG: bifunctional phosphopantothenoylcysteine decarboxylase/phosphopantothenate--cysteine ligase CoaBC [Ignavibacteriae bacterium]|nr:bifunctional phosphopantothenoylcysteine decarboxylase/phosphopantothenate--cysteine ligase CoaBC [Ignavibacteriota bacterium]